MDKLKLSLCEENINIVTITPSNYNRQSPVNPSFTELC